MTFGNPEIDFKTFALTCLVDFKFDRHRVLWNINSRNNKCSMTLKVI